MDKSNKDAKFKAPKITSSPKKSNSSSSTKSKMSPSVKNGLVFGGIAVVLIIVTVIFMMSNGNGGSQKYINNYGDIKTSITLNTTKLEATLNGIIDGKTMSQIGSYKCIDENSSSNTESTVEQHYELYLNTNNGNETIKMNIINDVLTLIYSDGTTITYNKE